MQINAKEYNMNVLARTSQLRSYAK